MIGIVRHKSLFSILKIHFESPPQYDFSRKSFIPNLSKLCFFPSYAKFVDKFPSEMRSNLTEYMTGYTEITPEERWMHYYVNAIKFACLERIFIGIEIFAIVLGLILSIWMKLDSEFQNLHKPAVNKNDYELSTVRSTLLRTDEEGSFNTSKCHEESVIVEESFARNELE